MPIDFEEIIRDENTYPDSFELPFGNEKIRLGDIRDRSRKQQKMVADAMSQLQAQREMVDNRQKQVEEYANKAQATYTELQRQYDEQTRQAERAKNVQANGGYDPEQVYENDIWYSPIRKRLTATDENLKKLSSDMTQMVNAVKGLAGFYTDDRMQNEFDSSAEMRKRSKQISSWDYDQMKKYVEDNKIYDKRGMPSVKEAVNRLTLEERNQASSDDAYQRGLREGEMRARMGSMPRPASAAAAMPGGTAQRPPDTIDEALSPDSIQQDEELMKMLADLSHAGADLTTGGSWKP
jgi:DNA repair exonuclease SbcCD ATPase subunit